jgi:F0F1-type ATP synthase alpha subunit
MDVEKQVLVIWSATNGYTDDVAIEDIRRFETSLLKFVENSRPGLLADIREQKAITDDIKAGLKQVLEDFKVDWSNQSSTATTEFAAAPAKPAASPAVSPVTSAAAPTA